MEMLNHIDSTMLCPDCCTIRTSRSRHCSVCGHCVERFDHHCPWINNCVGVQNHNYFLLYIGFQTLVIVTGLTLSVTAMVRYLESRHNHYNDIFSDIFPVDLEYQDAFYLPFLCLLICLTAFFTLPLFLLLYVQMMNFKHGKTTMERFGRSGGDNDRETRIINSGIVADT